MDGENNGNPMKTLLEWMIWGVKKPSFWVDTHLSMASLGPVVSRCTRPGLRPEKRLLRLEGEEFCEPYLVLGKAM